MSGSIYLLKHERPVMERTQPVVLGVFSTPEAADEARQYFATQQGFRDYPCGFVTTETRLDQHLWDEGFVKWRESSVAMMETF